MGQVPSKGQGINQKGQQIRNEEITSSARQIYVHFWGLFSEFDQFVYQIMSEMKRLYDGTPAGTCRGAANTNVFPQNLGTNQIKLWQLKNLSCKMLQGGKTYFHLKQSRLQGQKMYI